MENTITISDFIKTKYREYWNYSNSNGKNAIDSREQVPEVVRKIIYASYMINLKEYDERKSLELIGEVAKYHAHSNSSIEDSIKGVASAYKSQKAARILEGIGNFGNAPGDEGAAGRYISVSGTPLLTAMYKDIPFVPFDKDDTGLEQPSYISAPLPFALINGYSPIGTGKSCYLGERDAKEVIDWIDALRSDSIYFNESKALNNGVEIPKPMSVTGCKTWIEESNGYIYYEAIVHRNVDMNDITQKGKFDIITNLPPKITPDIVINKLKSKLPTKVAKSILDGAGKGRKIWIVVPKGYLDEDDYMKFSLKNARKENVFTWDHEHETMRASDIYTIAREWFEDRCSVVSKRIGKLIDDNEAMIHKIDLIKVFAENKMIEWNSEEVFAYFIEAASDRESGIADANLVLSQSARTFLPENLAKNEILREKTNETLKNLHKKLENIGDTIIDEAKEIIEKQEKFFEE